MQRAVQCATHVSIFTLCVKLLMHTSNLCSLATDVCVSASMSVCANLSESRATVAAESLNKTGFPAGL